MQPPEYLLKSGTLLYHQRHQGVFVNQGNRPYHTFNHYGFRPYYEEVTHPQYNTYIYRVNSDKRVYALDGDL
jgi:hypothetical protein